MMHTPIPAAMLANTLCQGALAYCARPQGHAGAHVNPYTD